MSPSPVDLDPALKRLADEGYAIEVAGPYLLVHSVPYVDAARNVKRGTLISEVSIISGIVQPLTTHVILFRGDYPCDKSGRPIEALRHSTQTIVLGGETVSVHSFSNKPQGGYASHYDKITRYVTIIANEAQSVRSGVTAQTGGLVMTNESDSTFVYADTASSRAGIEAVAAKLASQKVAIVGVGGTGAYVLDLVAKTWAKEIHTFDDDVFRSHNAFRAPGAASPEALALQPRKVDYWRDIYAKKRRGIVPHPYKIDESNVRELDAFDFVFICVDRGAARKQISLYLVAREIPFVDVGMGVIHREKQASLRGILRVTAASHGKNDHLGRRMPFSETDTDDPYVKNIQIAELNSLNACLAVMRWKKLFGLYDDEEREHHATYNIASNEILNEDFSDA